MQKHRYIMNGRHTLFQTCHHHRICANLKSYYNIEQLMNVKWQGDFIGQMGKLLGGWPRMTQVARAQMVTLSLPNCFCFARKTAPR